MMAMLRATWGTLLMVLGAILFVLICSAWAVVAVALLFLLPARLGRKVGRHGATWSFRIFLTAMEALGAWDLDIADLDKLRGDGALIVAPNHPSLLDAVFIVTRHHSHAHLVCQALERGLTVFVEKPLALTDEQLAAVLETVERTGNDRVMVGFNRTLAPLFVDLQERFGASRGPVSARYLINAGRLDASSWYLNEELEGSRFTGEGGHFIDTLSALVGHHPVEAYAMGVGASVHTNLRFADGSVATISYVTDGSSRFPKETIDVVGDGRNGRLDNFQRVTVWSAKGKSGHRVLAGQDKGQPTELERFVDTVRTGSPMPIALNSLVATTRATLAVGTSLSSGRPVAW